MINIQVTEEEAKQFVVFQQNYDTYMVLSNSGVFDVRNGVATVNFGTITDIDCNFKLFKRGKPIVISLHVPD